MTILSLCDYTGTWSAPYREAGYDVIQIDLQRGDDVRLFKALSSPVRGVLAAPPCTQFASSGARWWKGKGEQALIDALGIVDACYRIIAVHRPMWWALENPIGRIVDYLGEPQLRFDPCDYGDNYTKRTQLWGTFKSPPFRRAPATEGSKFHTMSNVPDRANIRSVTPSGFARAFFESNP